LFTNAWILIALVLIHYTKLFFIDWIIWIIISFYIIYSAYAIIKKWFLLLLDISLDSNIVDSIIKIINFQEKIDSYHFLRTRESWNIKFVDVHLVFNRSIILVDAHQVSDDIENNIKNLDNECEWIFNIHLDPTDDSKKNIKYL
jgi:divalent metal cation (Fe/Co/Zn/Cd) transporter